MICYADVFMVGGAALSAFGLSLLFNELFIRFFRTRVSSSIREFVTDLHQHKDQTPTMGGIPVIGAIFVVVLFFQTCDRSFLACLAALFLFGLGGFWDDHAKIKRGKGISELKKWSALVAAALITVLVWGPFSGSLSSLVFPFFSWSYWSIGMFIIPWAIWILLCTTNAVNFTDGLDGLATTLLMINFVFFGGAALFLGQTSLALFAALCLGGLAGFLWFNAYPARIFMGDVGALAFGGALGMLALALKMEFILPLTGCIFVVEVCSVLIQRYGLRWFGKRLFKMAPLHHHFERMGYPETRITTRFSLVTIAVSLIAVLLVMRSGCGFFW